VLQFVRKRTVIAVDQGLRPAAPCGSMSGPAATRRSTEWPTIALIVAWATTYIVVIAGHRAIPWFASVPVLALLSGLHFSLQHEAIHGHPTRWPRLNALMIGAPLPLWCPFAEYRASHLAHHESDLTVPGVDPESYYVTMRQWDRAGGVGRSLLRWNRTLVGRMVIGPWLAIARAVFALLRGDRAIRRTWALHLPVAAATLWLVVGVAGLPAWEYAVGIVWGGTALTMLRSFVEHRDMSGDATRSAVVRSNRAWSLLFLNNNLHHTHHAAPGAPWYRLPELCDELGSDDAARAGAGWYRGYTEVARRYGLRPFDTPVHPRQRAAVR
jgi:fatty acid desaturase